MRIPFKILIPAFLIIVNTLSVSAQRARHVNKPENFLKGTTWKTDGIPFETKEKEHYAYSTFDASTFEGRWGHFITFEEDTFSTSYAAPCGNDCFTNVTGEYYFKSAFQIHIRVNDIARGGFCSEKSERLNKNYGLYLLERTKTGWSLIKV